MFDKYFIVLSVNATKVEKKEEDSVIAIKLKHFNNEQSAAKLVREGSETILVE